jgi:hypothetical protein
MFPGRYVRLSRHSLGSFQQPYRGNETTVNSGATKPDLRSFSKVFATFRSAPAVWQWRRCRAHGLIDSRRREGLDFLNNPQHPENYVGCSNGVRNDTFSKYLVLRLTRLHHKR